MHIVAIYISLISKICEGHVAEDGWGVKGRTQLKTCQKELDRSLSHQRLSATNKVTLHRIDRTVKNGPNWIKIVTERERERGYNVVLVIVVVRGFSRVRIWYIYTTVANGGGSSDLLISLPWWSSWGCFWGL